MCPCNPQNSGKQVKGKNLTTQQNISLRSCLCCQKFGHETKNCRSKYHRNGTLLSTSISGNLTESAGQIQMPQRSTLQGPGVWIGSVEPPEAVHE